MSVAAADAFGGWAGEWLSRVPGQRGILAFDASELPLALAEAVVRKRRGAPFYASPLLRFDRAAVAHMLSPDLLAQSPDYDDRWRIFDQLAVNGLTLSGHPQHTLTSLTPGSTETVATILDLADGLVVRSRTEQREIERRFGRRLPRVRIVAPLDSRVPTIERTGAQHVVVWAPDFDANEIGPILLALQELRLPAFVIARSGILQNLRGTVAPPEQGAALLADAALIVDASITDPGTALALARTGTPLLVSSTTGAHEYLGNAGVYDPWSWRSTLAALLETLGRGAPSVVAPPLAGPVDLEPSPDRRSPSDGPLLSLIVRTHADHIGLERCLESIRDQTYEHIETIVVNDAGMPIDGLVERYPFARLVVRDQNGGAGLAAQTGLEEARGEFCALVDGDDAIFPDYVARFANVLVRSGATLAYTDAITASLEGLPDRTGRVHGYILRGLPVVERTDMLIKNCFWGSIRVAFRRSAANEAGGFHDYVPCEDYELWGRLSERFDFVRAGAVTALYTATLDRNNLSAVMGKMYADHHLELQQRHPAPNRPRLEKARAEVVAFLRAQGGWPPLVPPLHFEPPVPLP